MIEQVRFFDRLASLPRTGWLLRGVTDPESVAEHSFGVAVLAAAIVDAERARGESVDGEKVLRMALLHDAAEVFTGDVPMPAKSPAFKKALHEAEEEQLTPVLSPAQMELWREAEACKTLEARIVKAADKLQMVIKASIYEEEGRGALDEFFGAKNRALGIPCVDEAFAEIDRMRA